jgi:hypothetical protein
MVKSDLKTARLLSDAEMTVLAFSPDRHYLAITTDQWRTSIWDIEAEKELVVLQALGGQGYLI